MSYDQTSMAKVCGMVVFAVLFFVAYKLDSPAFIAIAAALGVAAYVGVRVSAPLLKTDPTEVSRAQIALVAAMYVAIAIGAVLFLLNFLT